MAATRMTGKNLALRRQEGQIFLLDPTENRLSVDFRAGPRRPADISQTLLVDLRLRAGTKSRPAQVEEGQEAQAALTAGIAVCYKRNHPRNR